MVSKGIQKILEGLGSIKGSKSAKTFGSEQRLERQEGKKKE